MMADGEPAAAAVMALSFIEEYFQIPVVTRAYTTACVLTTAAVVRQEKRKKKSSYFLWTKLSILTDSKLLCSSLLILLL